MNTIPVFFTIDNNYAPYLAVALNSAIKNSSPERSYKAYVLHEKVSEENQNKIKALEKENFKIEFIPMTKGFDTITDRMSNRLRCDYFTLTIYFRLFIPEMFPDLDRAIYIDSDVIVTDDLGKLFDTDLGDCLIGACSDLSVAKVPEFVYYMEEGFGVKKEEYINSGVLLMNLALLREKNFTNHFLSLLSTYHFDCIAPDQDYLNAICRGKIKYLDSRWDVMPEENTPEREDTGIIHYNLFSKPWCYDNVQYDAPFWHYASDSGFMEEIKEYKEGYTDENKEADKKCIELLLKRGSEIPKNDITFKKIIVSGVKVIL